MKYPHTEPLIDNRGATVEEGCKVAYNCSGQVAVGTVISATPAVKRDVCNYVRRACIKVKLAHSFSGTLGDRVRAGKISVVKDPQNLVVIHE